MRLALFVLSTLALTTVCSAQESPNLLTDRLVDCSYASPTSGIALTSQRLGNRRCEVWASGSHKHIPSTGTQPQGLHRSYRPMDARDRRIRGLDTEKIGAHWIHFMGFWELSRSQAHPVATEVADEHEVRHEENTSNSSA
jgi:hypothetical protein